MRHKKGFLVAGVLFLLICMLMHTMSSCSMMAQSIGSVSYTHLDVYKRQFLSLFAVLPGALQSF